MHHPLPRRPTTSELPIAERTPPRVVVSAGFHKTHVTIAAREALVRGNLAQAFTGAYPTRRIVKLLSASRLARAGRGGRLLERSEDIAEPQLKALPGPELVYETILLLGRSAWTRPLVQPLIVMTLKMYAHGVARRLKQVDGGGVYHFRAGFGHSSLPRARALGMATLCDQTLAHPLLLHGLVAQRGQVDLAAAGALRTGIGALTAVERAVLSDVEASDAVLVNSDFVKRTFTALGLDPERIHVTYLGVDDNFLQALGGRLADPPSAPLQMLFAGRLEARKGADVLVEVLTDLDDPDWTLSIAGPVADDVGRTHRDFLRDPRVTELGVLSRPALVDSMLRCPVFLFPSYAEGSARVIFEAMACGCYIITTPNAGSIVEDGVHGALVEPWDVDGFRRAISDAANDPRRVEQVGRRNARLVHEHFRQRDYGDALDRLYAEVLPARLRA